MGNDVTVVVPAADVADFRRQVVATYRSLGEELEHTGDDVIYDGLLEVRARLADAERAIDQLGWENTEAKMDLSLTIDARLLDRVLNACMSLALEDFESMYSSGVAAVRAKIADVERWLAIREQLEQQPEPAVA